MTWSKIDDGFLDHPKVLRAGEDAANLYLRGIIWCNRHLTDGAIPREALCALSSRRNLTPLAERLVAAGLWEVTPNGWLIHGFTERNPTREEVEAKREDISVKRSEAGKRGGKRSGEVRAAEAKAKQVASGLLKQNEAPSRPVLSESPLGDSPPNPPAGARCASEERSGLDPEAALGAVRQRAGKRAHLGHDLPSLAQWSALVRNLATQTESPAPDIAAYERFGDWIAANGFGWMTQGKPSLDYLLRAGKLAKHLGESNEWAAAGRPKIEHGQIALPSSARPSAGRRVIGPAPVATAEERARDASSHDPLFDIAQGPR